VDSQANIYLDRLILDVGRKANNAQYILHHPSLLPK